MPIISIYKNIYANTSAETTSIDSFLDAIQSGKWQDKVLKVRIIKDKDERKKAKEKLPYVTISGRFGQTRKAAELSEHSGFISMDIDNIANELEGIRTVLKQDPYVYSCFTSVSGTGLCVLFRINPGKHAESFDAIADYLIGKYQIVIDPSGKDVSRPRYVSFDPELFINNNSLVFKKYLPKQKKRKNEFTIFVQSEFDEVIKQMVEHKVSCVEDYRDWRDIGFGLADKFKEAGRPYYHLLSSCSDKYDKEICDQQYSLCMRDESRTGKITIATIYWFAKEAGINIYGEKTKKIVAAASAGKKANQTPQTVAENLKKYENITDADDLIKQAFQSPVVQSQDGSLVENVRMWVRHSFTLKRNVITRKIENGLQVLEEIDFNTMYLDAKIIYPDLNFELFTKIIFSHNTTSYNPITDFISSITWDGENRISQLGACINSNTGTIEWRCDMARKWYIGIVSSVFGFVNELNFILVGAKNTGKTKFFTMLLPDELQTYLGRSQLNRGTDDEILMCEKLLILNDEYGGKNKADERTEKRMMAAPMFSLRVPYGRGNEDVIRIATLCGTCNELDVLDDVTGNRRLIVMESIGRFNFQLYNSLDKYQLLAEAYQAFKNGERPELNEIEITALEETTDGKYSKVVMEAELIKQYMLPPDKCDPWDFMTTTQVKVLLENYTRANLNINKIGAQFRKLGYERECRGKIYGYIIAKIPPTVTTL